MKAAQQAEAVRRIEVEQEPATPEIAALQKTMGSMVREFIQDRGPSLSPKTAARYAELADYIGPDVMALPVAEVTPLQLHQEWKRLAECGGHHRRTRESRPLSAKTVRNIAGVVSSAYGWAILYGLCIHNPVTASKPPRGPKRKAVALTTLQQDLIIASATAGPWCLSPFLETEAALGARRGEVLALRWSDIANGFVNIARSLCQVKDAVSFKCTKTDRERCIEVPARTLAILETHRQQQAAYRAQFGPDYRTDLDLVFATPEGEPLKPDSVSSAVSLLCRRLKLPKGASLHTLRHTHGSQLLAGGVPIPEVSARLGHGNPSTTMSIYAHEIPGRGDAAKRWEEMQIKTPEEKTQ